MNIAKTKVAMSHLLCPICGAEVGFPQHYELTAELNERGEQAIFVRFTAVCSTQMCFGTQFQFKKALIAVPRLLDDPLFCVVPVTTGQSQLKQNEDASVKT